MADWKGMRPEKTSSAGEEVFLLNAVETAPPESGTPSASEEPAPSGGAGPAPQESSAPSASEELPASNSVGTAMQDGGGSDKTEPGTLELWLREPVAGGISCAGWAGIGLAAGLLAAAAAAAISLWLRRRRKRAGQERGQWSGAITVEKLHEQGAREGQQDCFFVSPAAEGAGLLAVVADGMGGLADGDKVSRAAVSAMAQGFFQTQGTPAQVLLQLAEQANAAVNRLLGEDGAYRSGSTLTAGLIRDGAFHYLSVGDSRICLYRNGELYQLNREHIYRNELSVRFVNGEQTLEKAEAHPKGAGLTSFLGMGQLKYIDLPAEPVAVRAGDRFILMSDGVYNALTPDELKRSLEQDQAAQALREAIRAKNYQNQDNYTAVILNCC